MGKLEYKKELNSRQWKLYNYLKERGDKWTVQEQIAREVPEYKYIEDDFVAFHDNPARHLITNDIRVINDSGLIQKVILSGPHGIKIANSDEFDIYIGKQIDSVLNRLKRLKKMADKGSKDGQMKLVINGQERDTVLAFIDSL